MLRMLRLRPIQSLSRSYLINPSFYTPQRSSFNSPQRNMHLANEFELEPFLADREAPLCSLNIVKSFEQLRCLAFQNFTEPFV